MDCQSKKINLTSCLIAMEFQLKSGWFDYLMSGFFLGLFFMVITDIYLFESFNGFPYNAYLFLAFVSFIAFIITFVIGSHKSSREW